MDRNVFFSPFLDAEDGAEGGADQPNQEKTFTQADVDKIVADRLKREQQKYQKDADARVEAAKAEAEKRATLTAEEKAKLAAKEALDKLNQREQDITRRELRAYALETLAEKGLPNTLAEALNYAGKDECTASLEALEKAFRASVQTGVEERMKGTPPKDAGKTGEEAHLAAVRAAMGLK